MKARMSRIFTIVVCFAVSAAAQPEGSESVERKISELMGRMTLEEKLGQLIQFTPGRPDVAELIAAGKVGSVFGISSAEQANELQRPAVESTRLGIPLILGHDVIHGYRTIFPNPLAIASSFDPEMAELTARVSAVEARAAGVHWTFAPMVDVARDPRWGRIAEGAGEDPFLGSAMARAWVRGYQGEDLARESSMLACAKHFAAYGAAEGGRDYNTTDMSERRLRETYLPPFRAALEEGVGTYMTAFNALNGIPATANAFLLDQILREEWGFEGFVVSDYQAIEQLIPHGVAANHEEAALAAIRAGVDMDMVDNAYMSLAGAVSEGRLAISVVDRAVERVLRAKFELRLFERPYADPARAAAVTLTPDHRAASRRVAERSIVLLRNEGSLLPISKNANAIAVIGPFADSREDMLGSWHAYGKEEEAVSPLEGIRARLPAGTRLLHEKGTGINEGSDAEMDAALAATGDADIVLAFLGEGGSQSGEAKSRVSLDLPGRQQELLEKLVATGKPVVLVLNTGRPLTIPWAAENVPAILNTWFLGSEAGHAIAATLFGDVNPGGKLPVSFPRSVGQIPVYYSHLRTGRPQDPANHYTSKYLDSPNEPLYPFGHGLSYTKFEYRDLRLSSPSMRPGGKITVSVEVKNAGARAGDEVVQLYVGDAVASVSRPVRELKGFRRISLGPGEARRVELELTVADLQFWGDEGWVAEPGTFYVWIGGSSNAPLEGRFQLAAR